MASASPRISTAPAKLTRRQCEDVLLRNGVGRLACYSPAAGECYVVPVAYVYHPRTIYLALVAGQKLSYLTEHPGGVCFEVEEVEEVEAGTDWKTVVAVGDFRRMPTRDEPDGDRKRTALHTVFDIGLAPYSREAQVLCRIDVRKMSGRHDRWSLPAELERLSGRG